MHIRFLVECYWGKPHGSHVGQRSYQNVLIVECGAVTGLKSRGLLHILNTIQRIERSVSMRHRENQRFPFTVLKGS